MTRRPDTDAMPKVRRGSRVLLVFLTALTSIAILELASAALYGLSLSKSDRKNVKALTGIGDFPVRRLPNTFWHHDFNPAHPVYEGNLNSHGIKGPEFQLPKPRGELRVLCVGDSTTEGTGVEPDETFPRYLEEILHEQIDLLSPYETVTVINGGVGSHNSAFNLAYLAFRLLHFDPDVVVIKSSYNDYLPYSIPGMTYDYTHAFPNPYHQIAPSSYWSLAGRSFFLRLLGVVLFRDEVAVPFPDFSGRISPQQFQEMDYSDNADKFFVYAENLRSMILLASGRGMEVLVLDLPTSPDPNHFGNDRRFGIRFKNLIERLEDEIERIVQEEQVALVRTGPFDREDFWDHVHNTASGNKKIAESGATAFLRPIGQMEDELASPNGL